MSFSKRRNLYGKREWLPRQRDWTQRHRNMILYVLAVLGVLGSLVGLVLLPETVSVNPDAATRFHGPGN